MIEKWKPIKGYSDYLISNRGRVKSLKSNKILCLHSDDRGKGYLQVGLCRDGKKTTRKIHHLVAAAFIGPRPKGTMVLHGDGDSRHNYYRNLRYGTAQNNSDDAKEHGTTARGERHGRAKLKLDEVNWIRANCVPRDRELGGRALGRKFGVTHRVIDEIVHNRTWAEG
jgi:hypothetical protein